MNVEMKEKLTKKYYQRAGKIFEIKLNGRNVLKAHLGSVTAPIFCTF